MSWTSNKEGSLPLLKHKSLEVREMFAKAANRALDNGRTTEEAITTGLSAVSRHERSIAKEHKRQEEERLAKQNHVPAHLRAIREAQELVKKQQIEAEEEQERVFKERILSIAAEAQTPAIQELYFDTDGKLVMVYSDGSKVKSNNAIPEEIINKYISVVVQEKGTTTVEEDYELLQVTMSDGHIDEVGELFATEDETLTLNKLIDE